MPLPAGADPELREAVEAEATRRMTSLVAPAAGAASREDVLRLSMGRLFEQAWPLMKQLPFSDTTRDFAQVTNCWKPYKCCYSQGLLRANQLPVAFQG